MARDGISVEGIGVKYVTMDATGMAAIMEGTPVTVVGDLAVGVGVAGDPVFGVLTKYEADANGSIQYRGFVEVPCAATGTTVAMPVAGDYVVLDGTGKVHTAAAGKLVVAAGSVVVGSETCWIDLG